ncbi:MAG: diguanylate cyclase [Methyloprofundus sp.]|nr:diguanylate cyclase [Methyloprofundus sp.]
MNELKFKGLHRKLLFLVLSVALVLALVASVVLYQVEYHRSVMQTEQQLKQLIDAVEQTAVVAVYSHNEQIATEVLVGLLANDSVYRAEIKSQGGFVLSQAKETFRGSDNAVRRLLYSPFGDNEWVGQLIVQWPESVNQKVAEQRVISNAVISITLIGVTAMVILLLIRAYITQPLRLASNTLHAIRLGEAVRIPVLKRNSNDELGRLIVDTNDLLAALEKKFNTEHELRTEIESIEKQLRHVYNASSAGLFLLDEAGVMLNHNLTLEQMVGLKSNDNQALDDACVFAGFFREPSEFEVLLAKAFESGQFESLDLQLAGEARDEAVWMHCLMSKVIDTQGNALVEGVLLDVSERVRSEQTIKHEVMHDALTGLLSRSAVQSLFSEHIALDAKRNSACFLMMDLDGFKLVNDTHGHLVGDAVLKIVAGRLLNCVRATDMVCRLGGDEFVVVLLNSHSEAFKFEVAEKIVRSISQLMLIKDQLMIKVGVSVGMADFQETDGCAFDCLLERADKAMYEVKRDGKSGYAFIDQDNKTEIVHLPSLC